MNAALRRNGKYRVTLSQAEVFEVLNALIESAKKIEAHEAQMRAAGRSVSPVWSIEARRTRDLAERIRNEAEFVKPARVPA